MTRVLNISQSTAVWGAEQTFLRAAPMLTDRGFEVGLCAPDTGPLRARWEELGGTFEPVDLPSHGGIRSGGGRPGPLALAVESATVLRSARRVASRLRSWDVGHNHSLHGHVEVALAGRLARRPVVLHLHDLVAPGLGRRLLDSAVRVADHSLAITEAVKACVDPRLHDRVTVLRHGVDIAQFAPGPVDQAVRAELGGIDGVPLVGIVGRIDPRKGVDVFVEAAAKVAERRELRAVVVGAPMLGSESFVDALQARAAESLGHRVRFVGRRDDVPAVMRSVDVLVNASVAEPFGLTLLEAMACGAPVVATRSGGAPELVTDAETGLMVPPGDPASMASAMERLIEDPDLARALAGRARELVVERHDANRQADELAGIYERLAHAPN